MNSNLFLAAIAVVLIAFLYACSLDDGMASGCADAQLLGDISMGGCITMPRHNFLK